MNANELRVGNKVTIDNEVSWSKLKGEVMTVIGVSKITDIERMVLFPKSKYNISLEDCNGNLYHQFDEFIKPVILSPEILEKCGFRKFNNAWITKDYSEKSPLKWNFSIWDNDGEYSYNSAEFNPILTSLHQLQNLYYALTGEELNYTP